MEEKLMLLFFRGSGPLAAAIRWQTRGAYAHCGAVLANGRFVEAHPRGVRVSAHPWVRNRGAADLYKVEDITSGQARKAEKFWREQEGAKYDWFGVVRFLSRINRDNWDRWFCSELVAEGYEAAGVPLLKTEAWRLSPATLSWSPRLTLAGVGVTLDWWAERWGQPREHEDQEIWGLPELREALG